MLTGCANSRGPISGMLCMPLGKMIGKVATRDCLVSDIRENSASVAPRDIMLIIRPVTTWFVRRETVRKATISPIKAPITIVKITASTRLSK